ncbi:unnamed protein product [Penicillium salamii]|uniref:U6 small nuclear RNA (adenine-(43)-N(6))-methyltransferase n=1 Tax=Penicillium salamii TaxID=1612424 RepID=A0A9W4K103_9EURO|nr:unnamed protein product [Penicillium salamii]CAG8014246.1 unnamed protein product [Penicillium salamii]CAG8017872.1 unnamed protein product [Penicillium salamii]CAG8223819.1 unnamed protein product [Penicillium salamii]CAG8247293.1 unnamed protein product [Penicillium salamii]
MEPARSLYKKDVDFEALALQCRDFAKQYVKLSVVYSMLLIRIVTSLKPNKQLDFTDPAAVRQLTTTLLQQDFQLKVKIPEDRLCPPVPNRLNYIIWIQDLIDSTTEGSNEGYDREREVVGLDIGTGCIGIYPLLGCTTRPGWKFVATDIDPGNIHTARENVALNELESRIRIIESDPDGPLFPLEKLGREGLDFTMCNPPFYTSRDELVESAKQKKRPPFSACTGAEVEMVTRGGEIDFVRKMIDESLHLRCRIQWYTSMLGKMSSVSVLVEELIKHENHNYAVTEFDQGAKTKRWAVAWSWGDRRPPVDVARGIPNLPKSLLPFPTDYTFTLPSDVPIDATSETLTKELASLPWFWRWNEKDFTGTGFAGENVWSRQARRKMKLAEGNDMTKLKDPPAKVALGVRVRLRLALGEKAEEKKVEALVRWIQGTDTVLFESFCGMVKRKLESR